MTIGDKLRLATNQFITNTRDLLDCAENDQLPDEMEATVQIVQALGEAIIKGLAGEGPAFQELVFRNFLYGLARVSLQTIHDLDQMTFEPRPNMKEIHGKPV